MAVIVWIVIGIVAGLLARAILPRSGVGGWIGDVILGVIGATFGGWLVQSYALGHWLNHFYLWSSLVGFGTAVAFLLVVHTLSNRRDRNPT